MPKRTDRILIVAGTAFDYGQALFRGAATYLAESMPGARISSTPPHAVKSVAYHVRDPANVGVIAQVAHAGVVELLVDSGLPVVNVSTSLEITPFPSVCVDDQHAGEVAARHVLDRCIQSAIFFGAHEKAFSAARMRGVRNVLGEDRVDSVSTGPGHPHPNRMLAQKFTAAESPVAVITATDQLARRASDVAGDLGWVAPVDLIIVGITDDPILCELHRPPLSSVRLPFEEVGAKAAAMLADLIAGREPDPRHVRLPAIGVSNRQSSGLRAIPDDQLRAAVALVERTHGDVSVGDLADETVVTQRRLEQLFREHLDQTPQQYIIRYRANRARRLLIDTSLSVTSIAMRCRFSGPSHMGVIFKKLFGMKPSDVRKIYNA